MRGLRIAAAATLFAALLGANAMAQETAPATEPAAATETAAPPADATATPPAADATAPAAEAATPAAPQAADEPPGRIIFFRPSRLTGAVYTYHVVTVAEDGDSTRESPRVGSLPNGRYFTYEAAPGIYNFNIRGPMAVNLDEDRLRIEIESGQTYYIEQTVRMGLITGGFRLTPSTQAEFERRRLREWAPRPDEDAEEGSEQEGASN
jgi:hypothetical protein